MKQQKIVCVYMCVFGRCGFSLFFIIFIEFFLPISAHIRVCVCFAVAHIRVSLAVAHMCVVDGHSSGSESFTKSTKEGSF